MGVTWVTDVVSWAHENYFNGSEPQYSYIWMVTDLINALHGVFIFIVVGCQPQVTLIHSLSIANATKSFHSEKYATRSADSKFTDRPVNHSKNVDIFVSCHIQVSTAIKRFWSSKTGRCTTNTTHGPQHSTSSQGLPSIGESVTNNTFTTTNSKVPLETICWREQTNKPFQFQ